MRKVIKYQWRTKWAGRTSTTKLYYTEEEIKREHPEAIRVDANWREFEEPETEEERQAIMRSVSRKPSPYKP
jgi:hypothetical protein